MTDTLFAAHRFACLDTAPFNARDYSKLKFGSDEVARAFGYEMADRFFLTYRTRLLTERCVVIPSAYNVVEIAATILARHFMNRLNDLLTRAGGDIVEWTTMHRTVSYLNDYADVSAEERLALLAQDTLYIKGDYIDGKTLIFVDDIQITGTHEVKIVQFLDKISAPNPTIFAYYAKYTGDRARIEGDLNRSGIQNLADFMEMFLSEPTHIMVRTLRLWMQADPVTREAALDRVPASYLSALYHAILARGYYKVDDLKEGFEAIRARYDRVFAEPHAAIVAA